MPSLGKYEILNKLAEGGMAELYLARQSGPEGFSKNVVIKRLLPSLAQDEGLVTMFLDEARIAARLSHTNIVQIYDLGSEGSSYFIAMEYVRGQNLAEILNREAGRGETTPHGIVAYIISRMCRGLHYAHTLTDEERRPLQIVHRDISPQNVLVSFQGEVKLLDFGIAKAASRAAETQAGLLKGKYAYMAPEQCKGEQVDHRSDIFSAGIVLYELVCHRRLFRRTSDFATMRAVIEDPIPPPSAVCDSVPDELEAVIMQALSRRPEERYQSAQEMQVELERAMQVCGWNIGPDQAAAYMAGLFPPPGEEAQEAARFIGAGPNETTKREGPGEAAVAPRAASPGREREAGARRASAREREDDTLEVLISPFAGAAAGAFADEAAITQTGAGPPASVDTDEIYVEEEEATAQAGPGLLAALRAQGLRPPNEADIPEQPTVPGIKRSELEVLRRAALTPLGRSIDDDDEEEDQTVIKPPDFADVEEGGAAPPGEDPLERHGEHDPTNIWPSGGPQSAGSLAQTVLDPDMVLRQGPSDSQPFVTAASDTVDLPLDAAGIEARSAPEEDTLTHQRQDRGAAAPPPIPPSGRQITEELGAQLALGAEDLPPPEGRDGFPWGAEGKPPTSEIELEADLEVEHEVEQASGQVALAASPGNRVLIPLLIVACLMVLVGGALAVYILVVKRIPRAEGGLVSLITEPPGATVYLNGKKRFDTTPMTMHGVPLGRESLVVVMLEGHKPWRRRLTLSQDSPEQALTIKLERARTGGAAGVLIITVREPGARVFLDGDYKGEAPLTIEGVASGVDHDLVIKKQGFADKSLKVEALEPAEKRRVVVGLRPVEETELEQGVTPRRGGKPRAGKHQGGKQRRGGDEGGAVEVPRSNVLPPLGGGGVGERVPERRRPR